jgi:hypothetical protein
VLDGIEELQLCVGYELDGVKIDLLPLGADDIERCKPIYESIPGWTDSTVGVTEYDKLPVKPPLSGPYCRSDGRAHRHGVDQPRPRSHHPDAQPLQRRLIGCTSQPPHMRETGAHADRRR